MSTRGYGDSATGDRLDREWQISRACGAPRCAYSLTRQMADAPSLTTRLIHKHDGWHADWPLQTDECGGTVTHPIYWDQRSSWVLRFSQNGSVAEAHETNFSYTRRCGYGTDKLVWQASLVTPTQ